MCLQAGRNDMSQMKQLIATFGIAASWLHSSPDCLFLWKFWLFKDYWRYKFIMKPPNAYLDMLDSSGGSRNLLMPFPLWSDHGVIPTPWQLRFTSQISNCFCKFLLGRLKSGSPGLINLRVALNAINARRLPLALLVFVLVRPLLLRQANPPDVITTHQAWVKAQKEIVGLMLLTMDPEIQTTLEHLGAYDMLKELKKRFVFYNSYIDNLERLGHAMTQNLSVNLILVLLRKECEANFFSKRVAPALIVYRASENPEKQKEKNRIRILQKGNQGKKAKRRWAYTAPVQAPPFTPKPRYSNTQKQDNTAKDGEYGLKGSRKLKPGALSLHYGYVYLLKHKHEVFETFKVFQKEVENQLGNTIKSLRYDHGGEYISKEFLDHLRDHGIIAHKTPPYTPQHNGVSERRNRTLLDMVRSMMSQTTLPKSFWDYALESTTRILNMVPTKKGCKALVKRDTLTKPDKLEPRAFKCIFVGYTKETMGYSFYYPPENKVFVTQNAEFFENDIIDHEASESLEDLEIIQEEDTHPFLDTSLNHEEDDQEIDKPQSDINPIRRYTRICLPTDRLCLYVDVEEHKLGDLGEHANYKATLLDPKFDKWLSAMNVDMQSMKYNEV
ncbi:retrotransposon protein, putative, ty1-copia subclass [Tanacetum coccineum]